MAAAQSGNPSSEANVRRHTARHGRETKRELECLTLHAADLLPVGLPCRKTDSPVILLETPSRQKWFPLPVRSQSGDANMLIMAKSGGGRLSWRNCSAMLARSNAQSQSVSAPTSTVRLIALMGGRVIEVES